MNQIETILAALKVFCVPGQVVELRALNVQGRRAVCEIFNDLEALARRAAELDAAGAQGVYFTPNPLRPDLVGHRASARKEDVARRHWFLIDVDPVRPDKSNSTEAELQAAWTVLDACRGNLEAAGLTGAVIGCSGNGWHLCYPIDLPNDEASQELVKALLVGLARVCGYAAAKVDTKCFDAPRIWKLSGTSTRKGQTTQDRPQRSAFLVEGQPWNQGTAAANTALLAGVVARWRYAEDTRKGRPAGDVLSRARAYIAKEPPAVSGQGGHNRTFHVACILMKDFALTVEQALEVIKDWNASCQPPWTEHELRHKLADAAKKDGPTGRLLGEQTATPDDSFSVPPLYKEGTENESSGGFPAPIPASQLRTSEQAPWLWQGFISRGGITLLSALWKSGKTTLLASMLKAMEQGGEFCGKPINAGRVLFVTEESENRWADRRDRLGLKDHVEFIPRPFFGKPKWDIWQSFLTYVSDLIGRGSYDLTVFDPLANLWPVRDENDASQVTSALMPLHRVADKSSILLVHHNRKGDGDEGTASRGSGALTAFVDTIVELRRYTPADKANRCRVLTGYGRDEDTVQEVVVELGEQGEYRVQGTREQVRSLEMDDILRHLLPTAAPGLTFADLMDAWPPDQPKPNRTKVFNRLKVGAETGLWNREGFGVRGHPHTYWLPPVPVLFQPPANGVPQ